MVTRFRRLMTLAILILTASSICWGTTGKNPPANPAPQGTARSRVMQRLLNASGSVKLVLRDHTKLTGRVVKAYSDHLILQTLEGDEIVERTIHFDQVKKVSNTYPRHPIIQVIAGNVVSSGTLALIILAAVGAL